MYKHVRQQLDVSPENLANLQIYVTMLHGSRRSQVIATIPFANY